MLRQSQGDSVLSTAKHSKTACMGNNSITQTMHKTMHSTSSCTWQHRPGSHPFFLYSIWQKLRKSLGTRLGGGFTYSNL